MGTKRDTIYVVHGAGDTVVVQLKKKVYDRILRELDRLHDTLVNKKEAAVINKKVFSRLTVEYGRMPIHDQKDRGKQLPHQKRGKGK